LLIEFMRSGGISGVRLSKSFDTDSMPVEAAAELIGMVQAADFFDLPPDMNSPGANNFRYKISVDDQDRSHTVQVDERAMPKALAPLVRKLEAAART
jgi:emfourin